jgi:hypothetical protein
MLMPAWSPVARRLTGDELNRLFDSLSRRRQPF